MISLNVYIILIIALNSSLLILGYWKEINIKAPFRIDINTLSYRSGFCIGLALAFTRSD